MAEMPDFGQHRRRGIAHAQAASGNLWTDYNVHDPGVTLLEQFCFALTELEYRSDFDVADLLAGDGDWLDLDALGLHRPRQVLPTRPVTLDDLTLALADQCKLVRRVMVMARKGGDGEAVGEDQRGLFDIYVIPDRDADEAEVLEQVRRAYHAMRNLCEDLGTLEIASPVNCRLRAEIEVRRRHSPERVAALIYDRCAQLMSEGDAAGKVSDKVSLREAFDAPEILYGKQGEVRGGSDLLDLFFLSLSGMPEVLNVLSLSFEVIGTRGEDPFRRVLAPGEYRKLVFPKHAGIDRLKLTSRGMDVRYDLGAMHKELRRARSERRERAATHVDAAEWNRVPEAEQRAYSHTRIGEALPAAYLAGHDLPQSGLDDDTRAAALQLRGYLAFSDVPIANASADLAGLPSLFAADRGIGRSYETRPMDFGAVTADLPGNADRVAEISARFDPWHDRKGRVLDYLLGLYGEAFSQNTLRLHDVYRGPGAREDNILHNRARLLREIASLDRNRSAAPDVAASQSSRSVGIGRKLTLLLGFADRSAAALTSALDHLELKLLPPGDDYGEALVPEGGLKGPKDPFHTLVPRLEQVPSFARSKLISQTEFMRHGTLNADVFRQATQLDAFALAEDMAGNWGLYLDVGSDDGVLPCGKFQSREAAIARANQLCVMFAELNQASEGLYVIEDILLRGSSGGFDPLKLTVVFGGWTARTMANGFRQLATETVELICPAHIQPSVVWLDFDQTVDFEALHLAWRIAYRDHALGKAAPRGLDDASASLRRFLADASHP